MREIVDGKLYDTKTATFICRDFFGTSWMINSWQKSLYMTPKSTYFFTMKGRPGNGPFVYKIDIINKTEAQNFCSKIDIDKALEYFGTDIKEG